MKSKSAAKRRNKRKGPLATARLALFGATSPGRWFRDAMEGAAEELDPAESDLRVILPEPDSETVDAVPREVE